MEIQKQFSIIAISNIDISMNNIEDVILFQIDKTSKMSKIYSQRELDRLDFGLTVDQWVLMKIIHENANISQKELADKSLRDPASITRTLDLLSKKAYVERQSIEGNRRKYSLVLTKEGNKFIEKYMKTVILHRQNSVKGMTTKEVKQLNDLLQKMQNNMI